MINIIFFSHLTINLSIKSIGLEFLGVSVMCEFAGTGLGLGGVYRRVVRAGGGVSELVVGTSV